MTQTANGMVAVSIDTEAFHNGYTEGLTGTCCRFMIDHPPTEGDIVEIIRNLCEIAEEGWLTDALLRHDAGLVAGWMSRGYFQVQGS